MSHRSRDRHERMFVRYEGLREYDTRVIGLRDAIHAALAYVDGRVTSVDPVHVSLLKEHTGGWFGLSHEVRALLEELNR